MAFTPLRGHRAGRDTGTLDTSSSLMPQDCSSSSGVPSVAAVSFRSPFPGGVRARAARPGASAARRADARARWPHTSTRPSGPSDGRRSAPCTSPFSGRARRRSGVHQSPTTRARGSDRSSPRPTRRIGCSMPVPCLVHTPSAISGTERSQVALSIPTGWRSVSNRSVRRASVGVSRSANSAADGCSSRSRAAVAREGAHRAGNTRALRTRRPLFAPVSVSPPVAETKPPSCIEVHEAPRLEGSSGEVSYHCLPTWATHGCGRAWRRRGRRWARHGPT